MEHQEISEVIITLRNNDLALRDKLILSGRLGEGYDEEMANLHVENAWVLDGIIGTLGYPTIDKVGEEASEAAWLVIQHAIGLPHFMKKCAKLLEQAVSENKANPLNLAYLTDRIAVHENKPQLYGTQFDWGENGELNPQPFDDLLSVNQRRKSIGLNSLEEQTKLIRKRTKAENQARPKDFGQRKNEIDAWRKSVGWTR